MQELESRVLLSTISLIDNIAPVQPGFPNIANPANIGSELFFTAQDNGIPSAPTIHGDELWKTDGTTAGTMMVKDINPGTASSNPTNLVNVGNLIFFTANDGTDGTELWKTDGTTAGTVMVKDIMPGSGSSNPANLTNVNGTLFFTATDAGGNASLWKSDGTAAGTVELAAMTAGDLTNVNGTLFFSGNDAAHGTELWKSDGTPAGTVLVDDMNPGPGSSYAYNLVAVGSEVFFSTSYGLAKSDGTAAGTVPFSNVEGSYLFNLNGTIYFAGPDVAGGTQYSELWRTDGTTNGTVQITRAITQQTDFGITNFWNVNGRLVLGQVNTFQDSISLYSSDGTLAGTVELGGALGWSDGYLASEVVVNGELYFNEGFGYGGLWQTDGTLAGTMKSDPSSNIAAVTVLGRAGNTLVFGGTPLQGPVFGEGEALYGLPLSPPPPTTSAKLAGVDTTTRGSWHGVYGSQGYDLLGGAQNLPGYAQVSTSGATPYVWQSATADYRALQDPSPSTSRTAACDYSSASFSLNIDLTDGQTHQVALYLLDWDYLNRKETITVSDAATSQVFTKQTAGNFQNGQWLVFDLSGDVTIRIDNAGPVNAVASALMFDPANTAAPSATASFMKDDTTTLGGWIGTYGSGGYDVMSGADTLPASVQLSLSGGQQYTWANPVADPRAPQIGVGALARVAGCYYSWGGFSVDLNLTDGKTHQVAFEALDYDAWGRAESVQVRDANTGVLLDSRMLSNFQGGQYLVYDLSGHMKITFTNAGPENAVLSGIFVDPIAIPKVTASGPTSDNTTLGTWTGSYGTQGYDVFGGGESLPSYASVTINNAQFYEWAGTSSDASALQTSPGSPNRIAACYYSAAPSFSINLSLSDGQPHQVALYLLDWDSRGRDEVIAATDTATGSPLTEEDQNHFASGRYVVFNVSGDVTFTITNNGGLNEVVSGLFIDPVKSATASFVKTDTTTQGSWNGVYGATDDYVAGVNFPFFGTYPLTPVVYASSTSDPRALQTGPATSSRIEAVVYAPTSFTESLGFPDDKTHQLAIYLADYDNLGRSETVQISDAQTGQVLDSQYVANFQNGKYLVWNVSGDLNITFTQVSGPNAVASGLFVS